MVPAFEVADCAAGEALFKQGDTTRKLHVVVEGTAHVTKGGEKVQELVPPAL